MPTQDAQFEQTFANLGHAHLRDKAPALFDYLVGFQILDASDDQTRAVGVFGCQVGDEMVYLPVFFLNGELKGHDLMYLKNQDLFVPLEEGWVMFILNRKPNVFGQPTHTTRAEINRLAPDMTSFSNSPTLHAKYAHATKTNPDFYFRDGTTNTPCWGTANPQPWVLPLVKAAAKRNQLEKVAERLDLRTFIRDNGPYVARGFAEWLRKEASIGEAVVTQYDIKDLLVRDFSLAAHTMSNKIEKTAGIGKALAATAGVGAGMALSKFVPDQHREAVVSGGLGLAGGTALGAYLAKKNHDQKKPANNKTQEKEASDKTTITYDQHGTDSELPWRKKLDLPKVSVITSNDAHDDNIKHVLTADERKKLLKGEVIVKDNRGEKSKVYSAEVASSLTNPDQTGVYKMLTRSGQLQDVLMIVGPKTIGSGFSTHTVAVNLENKAVKLGGKDDFYVQQNLNTIGHWWSKIDDLKDIKSLKVGGHYVIITPGREGTLPFCVVKKKEGLDDSTEYYVMDSHHDMSLSCTSTYSKYGQPDTKSVQPKTEYSNGVNHVYCWKKADGKKHEYENWQKGRHIVVTDRPGTLKNVGGTLFVPKGAKVITVSEPDGETEYTMSLFPEPGTLADAKMFILNNDYATPVKLYNDGNEYEVTVGNMSTSGLSKVGALKHLMCQHGLGEQDAMALIKTSAYKRVARALVKYASPYPILNDRLIKHAADSGNLIQGAPDSPAIPEQVYGAERGYTTNEPETHLNPVNSMFPQGTREQYNPDPQRDNPANIQGMIQNATQTGQKEIFDTAVIGGLLKQIDSGALVDKYIGDMILGMDRVGRVLFLFYQHGQDFKERYGEEGQQELEDALRNTFKGMGDVILYLKQKTIEPNPETSSMQINLNNTEGPGI